MIIVVVLVVLHRIDTCVCSIAVRVRTVRLTLIASVLLFNLHLGLISPSFIISIAIYCLKMMLLRLILVLGLSSVI